MTTSEWDHQLTATLSFILTKVEAAESEVRKWKEREASIRNLMPSLSGKPQSVSSGTLRGGKWQTIIRQVLQTSGKIRMEVLIAKIVAVKPGNPIIIRDSIDRASRNEFITITGIPPNVFVDISSERTTKKIVSRLPTGVSASVRGVINRASGPVDREEVFSKVAEETGSDRASIRSALNKMLQMGWIDQHLHEGVLLVKLVPEFETARSAKAIEGPTGATVDTIEKAGGSIVREELISKVLSATKFRRLQVTWALGNVVKRGRAVREVVDGVVWIRLTEKTPRTMVATAGAL